MTRQLSMLIEMIWTQPHINLVIELGHPIELLMMRYALTYRLSNELSTSVRMHPHLNLLILIRIMNRLLSPHLYNRLRSQIILTLGVWNLRFRSLLLVPLLEHLVHVQRL